MITIQASSNKVKLKYEQSMIKTECINQQIKKFSFMWKMLFPFYLMNVNVLSQSFFPTEIIYDNSTEGGEHRHSSIDEYGDEIIFAGDFRELIIFQFEYYGEFTPEGDETCIVRFYANDGEGELGFRKPNTMLYESEAFPIFPDFNTVSLTDLNLRVPNRMTWTVDFDGLSGLSEDRAGLLFRDPPSIGTSFDDIWKKRRSGLWVARGFGGDPIGNFAARFISKVDLSVEITRAEILENGTTKITIQGPPNQTLLIERSSDLENWTPVFLGLFPSRTLSFTDEKELTHAKFLRASLVQNKKIILDKPRFRDDGFVELSASGPNGLRFSLQSSTDLLEWKGLAEFTFGTREIVIVDDDFETEGKMYRIILLSRFEPISP